MGPNYPLGLAIVAKHLAQRGNTLRQGGVPDVDLGPGVLKQFCFGDHAIAVFDQIDQHLIHLRLQQNDGPVTA
jgi:hypothetical protein